MKKIIVILLTLVLIACLALITLLVRNSLNVCDDSDDDIGETDKIDEPDEPDEPNEPNEPDGPDTEVGTTPEDVYEIGEKTEYTEAFEALDNEELPEHILTVFTQADIEGNEAGIPVKLYFGTFLTEDKAEEGKSTVIRISLCDENGAILRIADLQGEDFYNGKYLCSVSSDDTEGSVVKYLRVIEMNIPSALMQNRKGMLTFSITCSVVDTESGVEMLSEKNEKNIWYKKTEAGYEVSDKKETHNSYNYQYITDISEYIEYIEPTGDLWSDEYLLLVNPWNPIEKNHELSLGVVGNQVTLGDIKDYKFNYRPYLKLNSAAAGALTAMFKEALATGMFQTKHMQVISAHRGYDQQESIFNRNVSGTKKYVCTDTNCAHEYITKNSYSKCELCGSSVKRVSITREEAETEVKTYSCAPGTSEHQTGLAVDLADITKGNAILEEPFKDTAAGKWLAENCTKFGFVLRFEKEKQDITGIIYEPWHFRYVGRYHASRMSELGMCLEEYVEFLTAEGYFDDSESVHNPANMQVDADTFLIVE